MDIETAILQSIEPVLVDVMNLEKRVESISKETGPAGKDADAAAVAEHLKGDINFLERVTPKSGAPGIGIKSIDMNPDKTALLIELDNGDRREFALPEPIPGKDADALTVAIALHNNAKFLEDVKGAPGAQGEPGEPGTSITALDLSKDATALVVKLSNGEQREIAIPTPPPGEKGAPGNDGVGVEVQPWEPRIYRDGSIVSFAFGKYYRANQDTNEKPGTGKAWNRVGLAGFEFKGVKNNSAVYETGDLVIDDGSLFLHNGEKFKMAVKRGRDGTRGENGKDAPTIIGGALTEKGFSIAFDNGEVQEWGAPLLDALAGLIERTEQLIKTASEQLEELKAFN